ncbi:MAG: prepilin-type N-terminal cleavage/methylation domain-containing protein [Candidatus Saccharimonadales bacterium]
MRQHRSSVRSRQQGFTIVELLIATAVLSTILVLVTVMMIKIGNLYYKGVNQARVQENVRNLTDEVSQQLELNGGSVPYIHTDTEDPNTHLLVDPQAYCIGTTRYSFVLNKQISTSATLGSDQTRHVLWRDSVPVGSCAALTQAQLNNQTPSSGGTELIAPNSRLTSFSITPTISPYTLSVAVAYGDTDLLNVSSSGAACKGSIGDQFCATASLTTGVVQRLTSTSN